MEHIYKVPFPCITGSLEDRIEHFVKRRRIREVTPDESESSADESMVSYLLHLCNDLEIHIILSLIINLLLSFELINGKVATLLYADRQKKCAT